MTTYGTADFLRAAHARVGEIDGDVARVERQLAAHGEAIADATARRGAALEELVVGLLPALSAEAIDRAVALTGAIGVKQGDVFAWREAKRAAATRRLAEIDADPRFVRRELLRAPRVGSLTRQIDELEEFRQPFAELVARAAHPRLQRLLDTRYGTEEYAVPFWRLSYYGDWKAGDEILERFPGKSFADLRAELATAASTIEVYDVKLGELRDELALGEALEREHARLTEELATLDVQTLARARDLLRKHLIDADLPSLGERLRAAPELEAVAKRWAGLVHKVLYLERMREEQLEKPRQLLRDEKARLRSDIVKYSRPKKQWERFPADKFEKRFHAGPQRFHKQWDRYERGYSRVSRFDHWDRGSFASDFLWWDLMTDGQLDGNFIPEVNEWRSHHPGHQYERWDQRDDADAATAIATADTTPGSDVAVDVS